MSKIISTLGQLNFFKWAINNSILEYISLNYKEIENDMNICYNNINNSFYINLCLRYSFNIIFDCFDI